MTIIGANMADAVYLLPGCAIVIFYAIFAYSFYKKLNQQEDSSAEVRALALNKSRKFSAAALILQMLVFFVSTSSAHFVKSAGIWSLSCIFIFLVILQAQIQASLERKIRKVNATHFQMLKNTVNGILLVFVFYGLYFLVSGSVSTIGFLISKVSFLSNSTKDLISSMAMPIGIVAALFSIPFSAPLLLRIFIPCSRIKDAETVEILENCFKKAGLNVPSFWTIDNENLKNFNAMISGLSIGRGPFRPALFFTKTLTEKFTKLEFEAIMLHEVSHISLGHIRKRVLAALLSILILFVPTFLIVFVGLTLSHKVTPILVTAIYLFNLIGQTYIIRIAVRQQELEADANAIRLGANVDAFSSALEKLNLLNDQIKNKKDPLSYFCAGCAHPTVAERIEAVRNLDISLPKEAQSVFSYTLIPLLKGKVFAPAYASMIIGFFTFCFFYVKPRNDLILASAAGNLAQVESLINSGISVNEIDPLGSGDFPLYAATSKGQGEVVRYLISQGADVNQRHSKTSWSSLFEASKKDNVYIAILLLQKGAKVNAKDRLGDTPLAVASKMKNVMVTRLLKDIGGRIYDVPHKNNMSRSLASESNGKVNLPPTSQ